MCVCVLAVLDLHDENGLSLCATQVSHCGGRFCCGARALELGLSSCVTGPAAPWHVESSQTRYQTHVPCTGRQILNHWTPREVQGDSFDYIRWPKSDSTKCFAWTSESRNKKGEGVSLAPISWKEPIL